MNIFKMDQEEVLQYSLSLILSLKQFNEPILEESTLNFLDFYKKLEIKQPILNFNNNRKKLGFSTKKNDWKRKSKFSSKETIQFLKNTWKLSLSDNDEDYIRNKILKSLNKLNESKFTIITKELLEDIEKIEHFELMNILIECILNKIISDENFQSLYAKLCLELSINKKWQKNLISVIEKDDEFFYSYNYLKNDNIDVFGPFESKDDAIKDGMNKNDFQKNLINKLQNKFINIPTDLQKNYSNSNDEQNIIKKQIFALMAFIFNLVTNGFIKEYVLYHCLCKLFGMENDGVPFDEEIEAAIKTINMMRSSKTYKMNSKNFNTYKEYVQKSLVSKIKSLRMKFLLEECFNMKLDNINIKDNIENENNCIKSISKDKENIIALLSECKQNSSNEINEILNNYYDIISDKNLIFYYWFNDLIKGKLFDGWDVFFLYIFNKQNLSFDEYWNIVNDIIKDFSEISIDYINYMSNFIQIMKFIGDTLKICDFDNLLEVKLKTEIDDEFILEDFNNNILNF
jgi:hypothetical protein